MQGEVSRAVVALSRRAPNGARADHGFRGFPGHPGFQKVGLKGPGSGQTSSRRVKTLERPRVSHDGRTCCHRALLCRQSGDQQTCCGHGGNDVRDPICDIHIGSRAC